MSAGLWMGTSCRQCGGELHEINGGNSDGVRSQWVGKCDTCRREFAIVAEMRALNNVSTSNQFTRNRGA